MTFLVMLREQLLILPIMLPLLGAVCVALVRGKWAGVIVLAVTGLTAAANGWILYLAVWFGPQVYRVGGWAPPQGIVLVADILSALLALVSSILALAAALHTLLSGEQLARRFYHTFFLLLLTALCGIFFTGDLFNLYVFMEMVILSSIVLVAMADRPISPEVTFKYTILSALGSVVLLFSIGLIYAGLGTLNMADIAQRMAGAGNGQPPVIVVSMGATLMLGVFLLKAGILPFHFWLPDAHSAAPTAVSAMLSGILVKVGIYGILRMSTLLFPNNPGLAALGILGAASVLFGGLAALSNQDLKRLLAYSTIANIGLILLAIGWGTGAGLAAAVIHSVNHALIKGSLFLAGGYLAERYGEHSLQRLTGLAATRLAPGIALIFGIGALALAGLPPTAGFLSKLMFIQAGWRADGSLLLLLVILAGALSIGYSTRLFIKLFWGTTPDWIVERSRQLAQHSMAQHSHSISGAAAALPAAILLLLGIWPSLLITVAGAAAAELQTPQHYINAVLERPVLEQSAIEQPVSKERP